MPCNKYLSPTNYSQLDNVWTERSDLNPIVENYNSGCKNNCGKYNNGVYNWTVVGNVTPANNSLGLTFGSSCQ